MPDWVKYYSEYFPITHERYMKAMSALGGLFSRIMRFTNVGDQVLETGIGLGVLACELSRRGRAVVALDNEKGILRLAADAVETAKREFLKSHTKSKKLYPISPVFLCADMFEITELFMENQFSIVYHQGVFEHFEDIKIIEAIQKALFVSKYLIFSVPNEKYGRKSFGDERLLSNEYWRDLILKAKANVVEEVCYGGGQHYMAIIAKEEEDAVLCDEE